MERIEGYQFLVSGVVPEGLRRCRSTDSLPVPFPKLLASADVIMTKPGYSTIIDAVTQDRPILYVRRYNFADEEPMVQYLHRYGRGVELSMDDFEQGSWEAALHRLKKVPIPPERPPAPSGAADVAAILAECF
jgi:hypothetical protein